MSRSEINGFRMSLCVDSDVHIVDLAGAFLMLYYSFTGSSTTCIFCKLDMRSRDVIRFSLVCLLVYFGENIS